MPVFSVFHEYNYVTFIKMEINLDKNHKITHLTKEFDRIRVAVR